MNNLAILIDCPDVYLDILSIFFKYFSINWSNCNYPVFITTNNKTIEAPSGVSFIKCGDGLDSIQRSKIALEKIESKYVLIMDCDCFISDTVDNNEIDSLINYMIENDAKYIRLWKTINKEHTLYKTNFKNLYYCNKKTRYSKSLMTNIWDKNEYLKCVVETGLDGWSIESKWLSDTKNSEPGFLPDYLYYANDPLHILHAVSKGKWVRKAYNIILKDGLLNKDSNSRGRLSTKQTIKSNLSGFFTNHFSSNTIRKMKRLFGKKRFVSED